MISDNSDDENVIRYGTPLEPYEEDEVPSKRKYQQKPDQYALDEHGRRRFHGAFTGGFSAGFGNTVGTPEGWTPSTFKSSRSDKGNITNQRPEDFMDEEDRSEFGIAPRHLQTKNEFSGQKRPHQPQFHDGIIPGEPVLNQLIRAVHETAAVKILRKMGWRPGQGVGDRVTRDEKKKAKEHHKVYGCYMPPEMRQESSQQSDSSDSEFEYDTLFAPDDYEPYILQNKTDKFGLGYTGLSRHSVLGNLVGEYGEGNSKSHLMMKEKGKKVSIRGQAFGVGAFEADDEDIYATEDMSHYDFALGGSSEKGKLKKSVEKNANVVEGFVKAKNPFPSVPSYPPPALPRDYVPAPAGSRRSRFQPTDAPQRDQGLCRHELTAESRGALLGEVPLPKEPELFQETLTQTPKPDLTKILGKSIDFVSTNKDQDKPLDYISIKETPNENVKVFRPFASNPQKQLRYERYLENKMVESDNATDRLSAWERNREMVEFEQAAKLYRPLSGVIGDRFTHASEPDEALNPLCAVAKSSINYGLATPEQIEAAKIGAYGVMTRKETKWRPEALVCKRFNVPEIDGERPLPKEDNKPKVSYSIFSYLETSVHDKDSFTKEQTKFSGSRSLNIETLKNDSNNVKQKEVNNITPIIPETSVTVSNKRMTVAELFLKESEKDLQEKDKGTAVNQTIEKFDKMDLYKSIFLSDSEEEPTEVNKSNENFEYIEKPKNIERNTSPPRGIFANIDFDELNSWKRQSDTEEKQAKSNDSNEKNTKNDNNEKIKNNESIDIDACSVYGPKIPDNLQNRVQSQTTLENNFRPIFKKKEELHESSSSDSWVEAKVKSKKQKKSKKSKHKKSKHKKKDR